MFTTLPVLPEHNRSVPFTWATGDMDWHIKAVWSCCHVQIFWRTMKVTDSSVICFHLQVLHGITVKTVKRKKDRLFISGAKVFGVPLESLPRTYIPEFGLVPWWVRALASQGLYCSTGAEQQQRCEPCLCFVSAFWWMLVRFFWPVLGL